MVCEKPLAMNTEEGKRIGRALADESGLICAMHLNCRAYPMVQQIRQMVKKESLWYDICGKWILPAGLAVQRDRLQAAPGETVQWRIKSGCRHWNALV